MYVGIFFYQSPFRESPKIHPNGEGKASLNPTSLTHFIRLVLLSTNCSWPIWNKSSKKLCIRTPYLLRHLPPESHFGAEIKRSSDPSERARQGEIVQESWCLTILHLIALTLPTNLPGRQEESEAKAFCIWWKLIDWGIRRMAPSTPCSIPIWNKLASLKDTETLPTDWLSDRVTNKPDQYIKRKMHL